MFPWLTAALMMWVMGQLCDALFKRTHNLRLSRSYPILGSQLLSALCIILLMQASSLHWAMLFISLAVGFAMSANAAFYAVNVDIAKERAGTAIGIMDAWNALAAFIAPTLTGFIVSLTGEFIAVFYLLTGLALTSCLLILFVHNRELC